MHNKTCIIICGPTASGKTSLAIELAKKYKTSIISADSRQCYKELGVVVAKPSLSQLQEVPHYFINSHSIHNAINAADFEKYALEKVEEIFAENNIAIIVGGTGLYLKAFCEGLDDITETPDHIKFEIQHAYNEFGLQWLQQTISIEDPLFATKGEMQNPHRMLRALEVIRSTGKSIVIQQTKKVKQRNFNILKFGIDVNREDLYHRINTRVDEMLNNGILDEAKNLISCKNLAPLQTVGYTELFNFLQNEVTFSKAIELIKQHTRNYAKRQLTWFKKDEAVFWIKNLNEVEQVLMQKSFINN
jgi:tRNA dimethylallyltransferase